MAKANPPANIAAIEDKAHIVRDSAHRMSIPFTEKVRDGEKGIVRFSFDADFAELQNFLSALPLEVFAHRAVMGGGLPEILAKFEEGKEKS